MCFSKRKYKFEIPRLENFIVGFYSQSRCSVIWRKGSCQNIKNKKTNCQQNVYTNFLNSTFSIMTTVFLIRDPFPRIDPPPSGKRARDRFQVPHSPPLWLKNEWFINFNIFSAFRFKNLSDFSNFLTIVKNWKRIVQMRV